MLVNKILRKIGRNLEEARPKSLRPTGTTGVSGLYPEICTPGFWDLVGHILLESSRRA